MVVFTTSLQTKTRKPLSPATAGKTSSRECYLEHILLHFVNPPGHTGENQKLETQGLSRDPLPPTEVLTEAGARSNVSAGYTVWLQAQARWVCKAPLPLAL